MIFFPFLLNRVPQVFAGCWGQQSSGVCLTGGSGSGQRLGSGGGRAFHGGQEVGDLGPLCRADVLAQVHYTVHGHLRVFLNQAGGTGRRMQGSFLPGGPWGQPLTQLWQPLGQMPTQRHPQNPVFRVVIPIGRGRDGIGHEDFSAQRTNN